MSDRPPVAAHSSAEGAARLDRIRERLGDVGSVSIPDTAASLGVSEMTIRRDLALLEALGEARRVRGGAMALGPSPFRSRSSRNTKAKVVIAEKVLPMVPRTGAIAIDSSTTMACLANLLAHAQDLLVVTNGPEVFDALQGRPGIRPILTGGERDTRTSSLVGPVAESTASSFRYDRVFLSAAAVDPEFGCLEATPEEAAIVRAFASRSSSVVVGADTSKLRATATVCSLSWEEIEVFVTELDPYHDRVERLRAMTALR